MKKVKYGILAFVMCATFACKNAEKNDTKEASKDNSKEKSVEKSKEDVTETPKEVEDNTESGATKRMKELIGPNGTYSKESEKKVLALLKGSWELVGETDPSGQKGKPSRKSTLTFDGKGGERTGVLVITPESTKENATVKIKTAIFEYIKPPDEPKDMRMWKNVLYIQHQAGEKGNEHDEAWGISQLDEDDLILEIMGGMGGQDIYKRVK